ncbi:MAG: DUF2752 domain-containing protein [Oscillospiraceae bacterium]|nr:DUF2752 domain-containing protein [Oscillospiraceae bacterium]
MQTKRKHPLKKKHAAVLLVMLPFAAFGLLLSVKTLYARYAAPHLPPCLLRTLTGWKCPGCGMTHSIYALTRFDLAEALRENAGIPFLLLPAALWYAECWLKLTGHPHVLIPRKAGLLYGCLGAFFLYCILRNVI